MLLMLMLKPLLLGGFADAVDAADAADAHSNTWQGSSKSERVKNAN